MPWTLIILKDATLKPSGSHILNSGSKRIHGYKETSASNGDIFTHNGVRIVVNPRGKHTENISETRI